MIDDDLIFSRFRCLYREGFEEGKKKKMERKEKHEDFPSSNNESTESLNDKSKTGLAFFTF